MACHLVCDPPHATALFAKPGKSSLKYLNGQLKEFTEVKYMLMDDLMTKEKLTSHYAKNCTVNDLRMGQIGPLEIDIWYGFADSSNYFNSKRSNSIFHMRSLFFDLEDYMCVAVLFNQVIDNSGVCPRLIVDNSMFEEQFFD